MIKKQITGNKNRQLKQQRENKMESAPHRRRFFRLRPCRSGPPRRSHPPPSPSAHPRPARAANLEAAAWPSRDRNPRAERPGAPGEAARNQDFMAEKKSALVLLFLMRSSRFMVDSKSSLTQVRRYIQIFWRVASSYSRSSRLVPLRAMLIAG